LSAAADDLTKSKNLLLHSWKETAGSSTPLLIRKGMIQLRSE